MALTTETIGGLIVVVVISMIISVISSVMLGTLNIISLCIVTMIFMVVLLIERFIVQTRFINKLDIVNELRNEVH